MNKAVQKVKTKLLQLGYIDNEWLAKYLELLEDNLITPKEAGSTQEHHAIPVNSYWTFDMPYNRIESLKLARLDPVNFKVNLLYKDHLVIHSYLTLCTNLEKVQQQYEAQSELRKRNSVIGVTATNRKRAEQRAKEAQQQYDVIVKNLEMRNTEYLNKFSTN